MREFGNQQQPSCHTEKMGTESTITIVGLGYVGCVTAACLAHSSEGRTGNRVIGVDRDQHKVQSVLDGKAPFYEPGLEELVRQGVASGRLSATTDLHQALAESDIALLCVGTPSEKNGNLGLGQMRRVCQEIAAHLPSRKGKPLVVAIRSTVFPGTCEEVVAAEIGPAEGLSIVCNPEFLREGTAVKDFIEPSLIVVGGNDPKAVQTVAGLYDGLGFEPCLVSLRTAEMIKYACNCFHAVKIQFANEIGSVAALMGVDPEEVMETLCEDVKLNLSATYLRPGAAFGGSCLPKDMRALLYRASHLDMKLPMLEAVLPGNREHLNRTVQTVLEFKASRLGIFGLAFKENTDDLRESPVVQMLEHLIGKGRDLRVFDPHIQLDMIYGANQQYLLSAIPHIGRLMEKSVDAMLTWAEGIVITQKPSPEMLRKIEARGIPMLDISRITVR
jgi:GDP-mannose 6-dehydrogenase